jgi:hypothetical protein
MSEDGLKVVNIFIFTKNAKRSPLTKCLSNNLTTNFDSQRHSPTNNSFHFHTSSTNVLCLLDEQHQTINNDLIKSFSHIS